VSKHGNGPHPWEVTQVFRMSEFSDDQQDLSAEVMRRVEDGQAAGLVAAWREAQAMAERFRTMLAALGLADEVSGVVGSLTDAGVPVVHVDMSLDGVVAFARLLDAEVGAHPPPEPVPPDAGGGGDVQAA
jgi:hypothetical protein